MDNTADKKKETKAKKAQKKQEEPTETQPTQPTEPPVTNIHPIKLSKSYYVPTNYGDRLEYVMKIFNDDDLPFIYQRAPLHRASSIQETAKYYHHQFRTIPSLMAGILYYLYKNYDLDTSLPTFNPSITAKKPKPAIPTYTQGQKEVTTNATEKSTSPSKTEGNTSKTQEEEEKERLNEVFKQCKGSLEDLALIFMEMCAYSGIKMELIKGLVKRKGYKYGESLYKHCWCGLFHNNKHYIIDPVLTIGEITKKDKWKPGIKPYYFFTPIELLNDSHRPEDDKWQMLHKPLKVKQFAMKPFYDYEQFYSGVFRYNVHLLSHYTPEFTCTTPQCEICYNMEDGSAKFMAFNCTNPTKKEELDEKAVSVEFDQQKHCHVAVISFPSNGEYEITMLGKLYKDADADYEQVLTFKVKVAIEIPKQKKVVSKSPVNVVNRQTSIEKKRSLSEKYTREKKMSQSAIDFDKKMKQKCYDNKTAHLFEPKTHFLRVGQDVKFKVKVKGAKSVFVLDGSRWVYLKRKEEDVYAGNVVIKNQNVVICALKPGNIYTEVFEFYAKKN